LRDEFSLKVLLSLKVEDQLVRRSNLMRSLKCVVFCRTNCDNESILIPNYRMTAINKSERLEVRVSPEEKATLETAAAISGLSISAYLRSRLLEQAQAEILAQQNLVLSQQDWTRFINAFDNPPPANAALQQAMTEYRQTAHRGDGNH
jgi:uncharacterized protein (DUF1778 family)